MVPGNQGYRLVSRRAARFELVVEKKKTRAAMDFRRGSLKLKADRGSISSSNRSNRSKGACV